MPISENKFLRYTLTQNLGKDAADKLIEILNASGSGGSLTLADVKTANYTASAGERVPVDASGGSFTVTLPASPEDGDLVGVFASAAPGANSVTISGTIVGAAHDKKLYVIGDALEFQYSSALSAWVTVSAQLTPHAAFVTLSADITTNTAGTAKKITFNTESYDIGACFDAVTNNRFTVKRAGRYYISLQCRPQNAVSVDNYYSAIIYVNGVMTQAHNLVCTSAGAPTQLFAAVSAVLNLASGDYVEGFFIAQTANDGCEGDSTDTFMSVAEIR
jgi:hypothetical protein